MPPKLDAGLYNIKLNNGNPNANSCSSTCPVGEPDGVSLIEFDDNDITQKWNIRPAELEEPLTPNYYTIQSETTGSYVIPQDDHLAYSRDYPFFWIINGGRISTSETPTLNWLPSDNGKFVIITPNSTWTWTISRAS